MSEKERLRRRIAALELREELRPSWRTRDTLRQLRKALEALCTDEPEPLS